MAEFRRDPRVEGHAAREALVRAGALAAVAAQGWFVVPAIWPESSAPITVQERDRILTILCGALAALAAWNLVTGSFRLRRWRRARHWERVLADPARAHLAPPLATHVAVVSGRRSVVARGIAVSIAAAIALGFLMWGLLIVSGRLEPPRGDDGEEQTIGVFGAVVIAAGVSVPLVRALRRSLVARHVERLSSDASVVGGATGPVVEADVAERRARDIPPLDVTFAGERAARDPAKVAADRPGRPPGEPLHVVFFRLFDNPAGTELVLRGRWRHLGYVHFLRSAEQVTPAEIEEARDTDDVGSLFIATPAQLDEALARQATGRIDRPRPTGRLAVLRWEADRERGRYPVRALLCHGTFWRTAVDLLLDRMDVVVLDLSGYRPEHGGTRFELQRVVDRFPIERTSVVTDPDCDRPFLAAQLRAAWTRMADGSPNSGGSPRRVHVSIPHRGRFQPRPVRVTTTLAAR